jgi:hypothetical protein
MADVNPGANIMRSGLEFMMEITAIINASHERGDDDEVTQQLVDQHIAKQPHPGRLVVALMQVRAACTSTTLLLADAALKEIIESATEGRPM